MSTPRGSDGNISLRPADGDDSSAIAAPVASPLRLRLFGPFEVEVNGQPLPRLRSRKGLYLLALLALRHDREVERSWLAGTLWPDSPEPQALISLRVSLRDLRRALGPEAHRLRSPTPHTVCLTLADADVDLVAFDAAIAGEDASSLEEAVRLHRGILLEEWTEEWVFEERQARQEAYLQALERLADAAQRRGDAGASVRWLRQAVGADPLRESAQRALMQALAAGGEYAAALEAYRELRLLLHRELNAQPDAETRQLFDQIRAEARRRSGVQAFRRSGVQETTHPSETSDPSDLNARMPERPIAGAEGTVTFLFTDVEGSTKLWEEHPQAMRAALARHDALIAAAIEQHAGTLLKSRGEGDSLFAVFARASDALAAACALQQALVAEPWPTPSPLRVRAALHSGEAEFRDGDYYGAAVNRCARLRSAAHGGQVLLSRATRELVQDDLPPGASLRDLGQQRLRDLQRPEHVFQLLHPDLLAEFPALHSLEALPNNLPQQVTSFIGREREIAEVKRLLESTRLLTVTGAGGTGKTRLALQVAADLLPEYPDGIWLVELAPLADPALVPRAVATVLGVQEAPGRKSLTQTLVDYLKPKQLLLLLDNCEHLLSACAALADALLRDCPGTHLMATSREALGIAGEQSYRVPPLSVPDPKAGSMVDGQWLMADDRPRSPSTINHQPSTILQYEAVHLFLDRARSSLSTFTVTSQNAAAVAQICHRLDGIPLAIELAAARVKALPVEKINERLDDRFRLLTGGSRTALPRQQTLRALIDWSYDLLSQPERALLRRLSVFAGGWTLEAAEAVCSDRMTNVQCPMSNEKTDRESHWTLVIGHSPQGMFSICSPLSWRSRSSFMRSRSGRRAIGSWRRCANMPGTGCWRAGRGRRCGGGTATGIWRWPKRGSRSSGASIR